MNSFGLKPSSFYHRGVLLGWYVTCATFLMTEQNYKSFFDFSIFLKKFFFNEHIALFFPWGNPMPLIRY
jgi:hypothetical protein